MLASGCCRPVALFPVGSTPPSMSSRRMTVDGSISMKLSEILKRIRKRPIDIDAWHRYVWCVKQYLSMASSGALQASLMASDQSVNPDAKDFIEEYLNDITDLVSLCVTFEMSEAGTVVRGLFGLNPLVPSTMIRVG